MTVGMSRLTLKKTHKRSVQSYLSIRVRKQLTVPSAMAVEDVGKGSRKLGQYGVGLAVGNPWLQHSSCGPCPGGL